MAVLVAVLYAFSRLASENEITALKAGGISTRSLMRPALVAVDVARVLHAVVQRPGAVAREPRAGDAADGDPAHQADASRCKPQVINAIKEGPAVSAGGLHRSRRSRAVMRDVTIYDVSDAHRRAHDLRRQRQAGVRAEQARPHPASLSRHG